MARSKKTSLVPLGTETLFAEIANALPGMVGYWDRDLRCRFANQSYLEWFGKTSEEMVGISLMALMGEGLFALNEPHIRRALQGEKQCFERTLTKADGSIGHTLAHYIPAFDAGGQVVGFSVLVSDVTSLKVAESRLLLASTVFNNAAEGIVVTGEDEVILSVNPAFTEITGYSAEEAVGQTPRMLKSLHHDRAFYVDMWRSLGETGRWQGEIWNRRKGGEVYLEWMTITRIPGLAGGAPQYVSVFNDITEFRRDDDRIRHLAFHDPLTDLPNRSLLMNRLDQQIARAQRDQSGLAVLFLDLDAFKRVNDTLGHNLGDALLKEVAARLQAQVRPADTVARLGGDEFVVLLDHPASEAVVAQIAERMIAAIREPMALDGRMARVGASCGIARYPGDGATPAELLLAADQAMYAAKQGGKNNFRFFKALPAPEPGLAR